MLALKIVVSGVVQGVGFRPFIKRIALKASVYGYVQNMGGGEVVIWVEGDRTNVVEFLKRFREEKPRPAEITYMRVEKVNPIGLKSFEIKASSYSRIQLSMIPPDIGICNECIWEIDNDTRWKDYPFNSCAYCGPRFSIIYKVPYDRENTSMIKFPLCNTCRSEYSDVSNIRRFHAQGISCPECGPKMWLTDRLGNVIDEEKPLYSAAKLIEEGAIIAIKGLGGFHIACLADDDEVVEKLRMRKRRPMKPFALMARDLTIAEKLVILTDSAKNLLLSPQKPILLLPKRDNAPVSDYIAPGLDTLGIMLPYTGIHHILLREFSKGYMIMTSGNYYNKPMETTNESALKRLSKIVDYYLLHNRDIVNRVDDSVIRFTAGKPVFLRRGRGFAPRWIVTPWKLDKPLIAFGAELQNVGGIQIRDKAILTQYIGDTDEFENLLDLEKYITYLINVYNINVKDAMIIADKHPKYSSRLLAEKWSEKYGAEIIFVQHHVAHSYAVLAEYSANKGVVIAMDGVGYGDDSMIWGGEVILIDIDKYERVGHLEYNVMPGGDLATIYPIRMLISILSHAIGLENAIEYILSKGLDKYLRSNNELDVIIETIKLGELYTSSTGRFLDAVSTLLDVCGYRSYEGEPAMKLEAYSRHGKLIRNLLDNNYIKNDIVSTSKFVKDLIDCEDYKAEDMAYTAQYVIGYNLGKIAGKYADKNGFSYVYVSGGAAVNDIIINGMIDALKDYRLKLRMHKELPPGDGSIAFGQLCYVANILYKNLY